MVLPRLGVEALETLKGEFSPDGPVFANRGEGADEPGQNVQGAAGVRIRRSSS